MASTPLRKSSPEDSESLNSIPLDNILQGKPKDGSLAEPTIAKVREHTDAVTDEKVAFLDTFSPEEEKRIMRKVDWKILPLIGLMQFVKQIDVANAASVKVMQLGQPRNILKELHMTADQYNWGVIHILRGYRSEEMGRPIMWMFTFSQASGVIGSLLCYGISYMNGLGGLSGWQWIFLLEGLTSVLFSGVVWFLLPDYPRSKRSNSWLTEREQMFVEYRLSENAPKTHDAAFSKEEAVLSLKDIKLWSFMTSQILINLGGYGLNWFLPTITTNLGFAKIPRNQLLNIPPAGLTIITMIFLQWFMMKAYLTRPLIIILIVLGQVACFVIFLATSSKVGIYIACILGSVFYGVYFVPFWAWRSSTLKGSTGTAFTLALQTSVAQAGGVIGPQLFQSKWAYNGYKASFGICTAAIVVGFFANCYTWYLTRNVEWDVRRIRRERIKAKKTGRLFIEDDIKVYHEREFFSKTLRKGKDHIEV
ncbi:hypothetical protein EG329_004316 [Mollisiaceae sp. DMI_Dod_QoI]|nr:hypothetical protein EG329_004316 [Helotiales sp. DMI_Dod_QoI]